MPRRRSTVKRALSYAALLGVLALAATAGAPAARKTASLQVRGGIVHLIARGDRVQAQYAVQSGSNAVRGTLYVRNDRQRAFARLPRRGRTAIRRGSRRA
jgi:hypothetical protein